jgi:hypothetical protein
VSGPQGRGRCSNRRIQIRQLSRQVKAAREYRWRAALHREAKQFAAFIGISASLLLVTAAESRGRHPRDRRGITAMNHLGDSESAPESMENKPCKTQTLTAFVESENRDSMPPKVRFEN